MNSLQQTVSEYFVNHFGTSFRLVASPGRINLIGEHTDYNMGFVLPAAIDKEIVVAIGPAADGITTIHALDMGETIQLKDLSHLQKSKHGWANYALGVVDQFQKKGKSIPAFNCVFGGNIPIGSGLSSSAALENGIGFGLNDLFSFNFSKDELLHMSQKAEHEFVGVKCGIMDQFASMMGQKGNAMKLDCRSLEYQSYPVNFGDYEIILFNSNVSHNLASSEYNKRREQCEEGTRVVASFFKDQEVNSLRDVTMEMLQACQSAISPLVFMRCKYVIEENERVHAFCAALERGDYLQCGELLFIAHEAMRNKYEITCPEIDLLVDFVKGHPAVLGSRMMGGGFGGCTLNLVRRDLAEQLIDEIRPAYFQATQKELSPYRVAIADGVRLVKV